MRKADLTTTREFTDEDGDVLVLRTQLTKAIADEVSDLSAGYHFVPGSNELAVVGAVKATNRLLFTKLAVSWTVGGVETEPTAEEFDALDEASGQWVCDCIREILRERRERAEGNSGTSSAKPGDSQPSSPEAEPPTPTA